jgi:dipeptidyl aminopeptidase/acylaminoacyl peptidase
MIEDHEDAVNWAVQQGFADPAKICISGASYGGYAALMGPAKNPGFYKCAVAGLAPTDMKYQLTSMDGDTALSVSGQDYWKKVVGAEDVDAPIMRQVSPLYLADRIKIPVFLYAGRDDVRVPIAQIERMAKALTASGNPPKAFVAKSHEGHGFSKLENRVDLYKQILEFLDKHLAP